jgi:hypothetical protein
VIIILKDDASSFGIQCSIQVAIWVLAVCSCSSLLGNGAIGEIPSLPYRFCLEHFLGTDPDVISWDYSMNEGPWAASVLEAFLCQATQQGFK